MLTQQKKNDVQFYRYWLTSVVWLKQCRKTSTKPWGIFIAFFTDISIFSLRLFYLTEIWREESALQLSNPIIQSRLDQRFGKELSFYSGIKVSADLFFVGKDRQIDFWETSPHHLDKLVFRVSKYWFFYKTHGPCWEPSKHNINLI